MRPDYANDSEGLALFRAALAHPDEDTPRLVFADWLQERGEEKRAAFIRAQVDLFHRKSADSEATAVREIIAAVNLLTTSGTSTGRRSARNSARCSGPNRLPRASPSRRRRVTAYQRSCS